MEQSCDVHGTHITRSMGAAGSVRKDDAVAHVLSRRCSGERLQNEGKL